MDKIPKFIFCFVANFDVKSLGKNLSIIKIIELFLGQWFCIVWDAHTIAPTWIECRLRCETKIRKQETLAWRSRNGRSRFDTQKYPSNISVNFGWSTRERDDHWKVSHLLDMIEHFKAFKKHERLQCVYKEEKWARWRQRLEIKLKNGEIIASDVKNKIEVFPHCEFPFCQCTHNHFTRSLLKWKTLHEHKKNLSILIFLFSLARCYLFLNIYRKARCDMRSPLTTAFFFFALFLSLHCQ